MTGVNPSGLISTPLSHFLRHSGHVIFLSFGAGRSFSIQDAQKQCPAMIQYLGPGVDGITPATRKHSKKADFLPFKADGAFPANGERWGHGREWRSHVDGQS